MLLLDSRVREINGISVFPDHADPEQWYYMPTAPHLTTVRDQAMDADIPQFLLIGYRGDAGTGGFLNFDCNVGASQRQIDDLAREIANKENLRNAPRIGPVPLVDGTVKLLMLGKQSGDAAPAAGDTGPQFVLKIDHHAKPALYGANQASFSVRLDQAGFTTMRECLDGEIMPVAVIYSLDFLGLRPAYSIRLKVDWDRVQEHMDESFSASVPFFSTEIGKAVDELVEDRAILLESDTFVAEGQDTAGIIDRRDAALAQVRTMITEAFFTPSLPPWTPEKKSDFEKGLEALGKFASQSAAAGATGGATGMASFSYKRMDYKRIDKKSLNVNFSERVAVKKSIYPQGHLAGLFKLLRDLGLQNDSRFVKQVSLDDDWFKQRQVRAVARADFAADEIASINVRARYGDAPKNELLDSAKPAAEFKWLSQLGPNRTMKRDVSVAYEVRFKTTESLERPTKLTSSTEITDLDNVEIVPRDLYGINPVTVIAENFPWDRYTSVEAHMRYFDEPNGIRQQDLIRLTKEKPDAVWKMFVLDPAKATYEVRLLYRAANNRDVDKGWVQKTEPQVTIRNPFPTERRVQVVPALNWDEVSEAFVDLRYEDTENNLLVEDSLTLVKGAASQVFKVDLRNPELKTVFYRVTIIWKDGHESVSPESMTSEPRIVVRPNMKGRRVVAVRAPRDFERRRLRKVTAELRFEDLMANIAVADTFNLESPTAKGEFEYDYVDEARDQFEHRAVFLFENGLEQSTEWVSSDATELVLRVP